MTVLDGSRLRFGLYVGEGASHSWTWFVDLLERRGLRRLRFLDENGFGVHAPEQDVLLVSGGDTFAVARALGPQGAEALRSFLDRGGLYIGSCAGAYLPLHSSKEPLCDFNFVKARIQNLARDLPPVERLAAKYAQPYGGCAYVYHPAREEVRVRMAEGFPVWGGREIRVPLYGGPPLEASGDILPQAFYTGFTDRTVFLTQRGVAEAVYLGKVAACEKAFGRGRMVLLGPHFEHPWFPEGNDVIFQWIAARARAPRDGPDRAAEPGDGAGPDAPAGGGDWLRALKGEVSNMRIRASALARQSLTWRVGAKTYEPEKIEQFLEAVWKRLVRIPSGTRPLRFGDGQARDLLERAAGCHRQVRLLAEEVREGGDGEARARELFPALKRFAVAFLEFYFRQALRPPPERRARCAQGRG